MSINDYTKYAVDNLMVECENETLNNTKVINTSSSSISSSSKNLYYTFLFVTCNTSYNYFMHN